ncbi:MAG: BatA and WFA domain-containing protein, partial [Clostridia bacterium]|nr:BatA and WFA domain-containing protein [Clostridia bacterium]
MSFLYPLGLLGLLAIPVLILIYIIKSKYTEQVIPSTYLWTLSERFLKRKNPVKAITGIISLILQILAVIFISIALAHPVFTLKGQATDYCFILDGSGSMNVVQGNKTVFEEGKDRIRGLINSAADGSSYTLITTGNTTDVTVKQSEDKKATIRLLDMMEPSCVASDFNNAVLEAQKLFDDVPSCKFYLVTDKDFDNVQNIEHIKLTTNGKNYALSGVDYSFNADGGVTVSGKVFAYSEDAEVDVDIRFNGESVPTDTVKVSAKMNQGVGFTLDCDRAEFTSMSVALRQKDALALDDEVILYHSRSDAAYKTLIVSEEPLFLETMFASLGNIT